jgi:hypothetical protein
MLDPENFERTAIVKFKIDQTESSIWEWESYQSEDLIVEEPNDLVVAPIEEPYLLDGLPEIGMVEETT